MELNNYISFGEFEIVSQLLGRRHQSKGNNVQRNYMQGEGSKARGLFPMKIGHGVSSGMMLSWTLAGGSGHSRRCIVDEKLVCALPEVGAFLHWLFASRARDAD